MLYLPAHIPCAEIIRQSYPVEEIPLGGRCAQARAVLVLNLMPEKAACELQIARMLAPVADDEHPLQMIPVKIPGQIYKTTPMAHMEAFYEDLSPDTFSHFPSDALLIITGAPLENVAYEDVRYWAQLCEIFDWAAQGGVARTLNICWAGFAALWHYYGIPMRHTTEKLFGIFSQKVCPSSITRHLGNSCLMPVSRHIALSAEDVNRFPELNIVAEDAHSGPGIIIDETRHMVHDLGHFEYEAERLHHEYLRDLSRGLPIQPAVNYYRDNIPDAEHIVFSWREDALTLYRNFIIPT